MLKKVVFLLCLILFSGTVFANIVVIKPVESVVANNGSVEIGTVAPGETVELIIQKKAQQGVKWQDIFVESESIPFNWKVEKSLEDESLVLFVTLPKNAEESVQNIRLTVSNSAFSESLIVSMLVEKNLLNSDIQNRSQKILIGEPAKFKVFLVNESIAKETVLISSNLPKYWFNTVEISLNPKESKELDIEVYPKSYGPRNFSFFVKSAKSDKSFLFPAKLEVYPTLRSKYTEPLYGFPIFTLSMIPYYLINSFLAVFF